MTYSIALSGMPIIAAGTSQADITTALAYYIMGSAGLTVTSLFLVFIAGKFMAAAANLVGAVGENMLSGSGGKLMALAAAAATGGAAAAAKSVAAAGKVADKAGVGKPSGLIGKTALGGAKVGAGTAGAVAGAVMGAAKNLAGLQVRPYKAEKEGDKKGGGQTSGQAGGPPIPSTVPPAPASRPPRVSNKDSRDAALGRKRR